MLSRNFCQKNMIMNFRNLYTYCVYCCCEIYIHSLKIWEIKTNLFHIKSKRQKKILKEFTQWSGNTTIYHFSYDVRGQGSEVGRHWNDGSLGARARFEERARPSPLLWIEDLKDEDEGIYRCRVDFKHAPTQNFQINLQVIGIMLNKLQIF